MLLTLDYMKGYLGIPTLDTSNDAFLTEQCEIVSDAVEMYCQRVFKEKTWKETVHGPELRNLTKYRLYQFPVTTVTSVKINGGDPLDDVILYKSAGIISRNKGFCLKADDVMEITYTAGFSTIPPIIRSVVMSVVAERYNKKKAGIDLSFGSDVQRVSIPGVISIDYDYSLTSNDEKTLLGSILGNHLNALTLFRSERSVLGSGELVNVD